MLEGAHIIPAKRYIYESFIDNTPIHSEWEGAKYFSFS